MPRLIDAERIVYSWIIDKDGEEHDGITLQSIIDKMPTVDAEPVRHGHWTLNPHNRAWDVCSACGIGTKRREYGLNPDGTEYVTEYSYRYCPNCGAKMDGERKADAKTN